MNNICKWKHTHIFSEYYLVSNDGKVKSLRTEKLLKPTTDKDGYLYYVLCVDGVRKTIKAHRLVAMAFIENTENKSAIDHINGIKTDNNVENLRWVTNKENTHNPITLKKVIARGKERLPKLLQASIDRDFGRKKTAVYKDGKKYGEFNSQKLAAEYAGVSAGKVSQCVSNKIKSCRGYVFKEIDEFPIAVTKIRFPEVIEE